MAIKINMENLAKLVVNTCPFLILEDEIRLTKNALDDEIINKYLSEHTAQKYIITELDYELLRYELVVFIKQEIYKRVKKQINRLDSEDLKLYRTSNRTYEDEKDGN